MKVYRIGTEYVDLDRVVAISEPHTYHDQFSGNIFCIPITYVFTGEFKIKIPFPEEASPEWGKGKEMWHEMEFGEPVLKCSSEYVNRVQHEIRLMKYNIWAPFLKAWENKDFKPDETTVE